MLIFTHNLGNWLIVLSQSTRLTDREMDGQTESDNCNVVRCMLMNDCNNHRITTEQKETMLTFSVQQFHHSPP